ncbi:succinate--CoA ligase subunit alpha [Desulfurococcaceae archaeon AG1]|nr:MAG: succinate--CoA ligase subunit alpha [Desulfurococcaceae archaeon]GAY25488.1 succinate--CoA ligase subunit alpha [Desulfurococcaceae archaeon AG1]
MAIIVDRSTRVLVQGITGREGSYHTASMMAYGTKVVAGVTPGKGGSSVNGVPVYNTVERAVRMHPEINTSILFVPAPYAPDAFYEAIDAGIKTIVVITEGIPLHDEMKMISYARSKGVIVVGPNCPGVISPGERVKVGIMPARSFSPGSVGIVSRSGTLTYEISEALSKAGMGQSTVVGIGGDPVVGLDFIEVVEMFNKDPETKAIVVVGEIGGDAEERLAQYIKEKGMVKPMVAYIAGRTAPPGKRMGHAGAIISMGRGDAETKIKALEAAGIRVAATPVDVANILSQIIDHRKA